MAALDDLLARVTDPALRADLEREIAPLRGEQELGLVFERHLPESVRLTGHPIRRGLTVTERQDDGDDILWQVAKVKGGVALLRRLEDDGSVVEASRPVDELVVVREFGEPIYPGLKSVGRVDRGGDKPWHVAINAENYHALEALLYTCEGRVDAIYIDPPYNLGGDLTYNDRRVAKDDKFRHSLWLAFMERRLQLARRLLADTGVILVAIDDTEQAHLRLLMDSIFGESNFLSCVVWQGSRKNNSHYISNGHDYMLVYAKSEAILASRKTIWRERKPGLDEARAAAKRIWGEAGGDDKAATRKWRAWLKEKKAAGVTTDSVNRYDVLEAGTGRPINTYGDLSSPGGGGPRYDVIHPTTGKPVKVPIPGWRFLNPEKMAELVAAGRIYFGDDETTIPRGIKYLDEMGEQVALSVFEQDRKAVNGQLRDLLGDERFKFPKEPRVLARWINLVTGAKPDALILDFFAGSGSTAHAVMQLNAEDGGNRRCISITNNEVDEQAAKRLAEAGIRPGGPEWEAAGVFQRVTRPRLEAVVTGLRPDGSPHKQGAFEENVEFFTLTYEDADRVRLGAAFEAVAPLLWLRAGAEGPRIDSISAEGWALPEGARYGVLFRADVWPGFVEAVRASDTARVAFIVTDSDAVFQQVAAELPDEVEPVRLYESYLTSFTINTGGVA